MTELAEAYDVAIGAPAVFLWETRVKFTYFADPPRGLRIWGAEWRSGDLVVLGNGDSPDEAVAYVERELYGEFAPWYERKP